MPNTAFRATHNNFQHPITSHKEPFFFFFLISPSHFSANSMNLTRCFSKLQGGDPFTGGFGSGLFAGSEWVCIYELRSKLSSNFSCPGYPFLSMVNLEIITKILY